MQTPVNSLGPFEFAAPGRIVFGWQSRSALGALLASLCQRAILVVGSRGLAASGVVERIVDDVQACGTRVVTLQAPSREPTVEDVDRIVEQLRHDGAGHGDALVALGGGSTIDLVKASAALVPQSSRASVRDYLEGVGRGLQLAASPLPWIAMPTTAGTGSEATKNAVIGVAQPPCKKSLRSEAMLARIALVDPELCVSAPPIVTAHSGMDAIAQLIESYVSRRATPLSRNLALEGMPGVVSALATAFVDPLDQPARMRMSYAAMLSGLALANGGLGLAHGVAAALGVVCDVPHGLACSLMLPAAMRFNLSERREDLACIGEVLAGALGSSASRAEAAIAAVEQLQCELGLPQRLNEVGVRAEQLDELVRQSRGNSMSGNPVEVSDAALRNLLEQLL
ncbi:MAG: iron-containing alcohol dehydrogenase [Pirellulales bacterium]|nr:iron-containing alcohol dehydrogenase [Pirellulales bacterium]